MPKAIKGSAGRQPSEPPANHFGIDDWCRRLMPDLQPIVKRLEESVRATVLGPDFAVKLEKGVLRAARTRVDHRASRVRRFRECRFPRRRRPRVPAPTRNDRPEPVHQGDQPGGGAATTAARVDGASRPHARLEVTAPGSAACAVIRSGALPFSRGTPACTRCRLSRPRVPEAGQLSDPMVPPGLRAADHVRPRRVPVLQEPQRRRWAHRTRC
jgi:hypothetical protein